MGESVTLALTLANPTARPQRAIVDFRIGYVKANGSVSHKTFKLKTIELAPGGTVDLRKAVTLADLTTRRHYPGRHPVELLINARPSPIGHFDLRA